MRKKIFSIIASLIMLISATASAATYTLPEKMQNQLAIGSGLKGSFTVTAEGELSREPFVNAVSDAVYDLRGLASGHDLHYYLFQENNGSQNIMAELYRKEGRYYFRSDIVQGKTLELSPFSVFLDSLFLQKGENPTLMSALVNYFSLPEDIREKQWKTVLTKYQNALEMWLHDFTARADVVKQENGSSAFDFSYLIPVSEVKNKLAALFEEFAADAELQALLDTVMTPEQKTLYLSTDLLWFYQEAVAALNINSDIKLSKRVSALGDQISSSMDLPLDPALTGYNNLLIESVNGITVYQMKGENRVLVLGLPDIDLLKEQEYEKSIWIASIDQTKVRDNSDFSVRADIKKTFSQYNDEEEKNHQEEHFTFSVTQDLSYLPDEFKDAKLAEWHDIKAAVDLHYHSKYSQNSATTLEIGIQYQQNGSSFGINGKIKTAAPWLFMPFEVSNPILITPDHPEMIEEYRTDWISNAASMIHHEISGEATEGHSAESAETAENDGESMKENDRDTESTEETRDENAETQPLPDAEETGEEAE